MCARDRTVRFFLMTVTLMSKIFKKLKSRTINYRSYKHFSNKAYREFLLHELSNKVFINNYEDLRKFCDININIQIDARCVRENLLQVIKCHL